MSRALIPATWRACGARTLFTEVTNVRHENEEMLSVTIGRGIIRQSDLIRGTPKKDSSNLDKSRYKLVEPGDIAYNKMRAWQGAVGLSRHRGIVSPAYIVMRVREGFGIYFHHLLRTPGFAKEAERWSYGITSDQWSLRSEHFKMIYFPFPPEDEQTAIVKYLGHANARIDRAIAVKRKLIALLEEQKQVVINQAVTRGLDPTVSLKDSGSPWLGQIPAHWQAVPLKRLARLRGGTGFSTERQGRPGGALPFFRVSDMTAPGNEIEMAQCDSTVSHIEARSMGATPFAPGAVLFPKVGGALLTNKRRIAGKACCIDNNLMGAEFHGLTMPYAYLFMTLVDMGTMAKPGPVPAVGQSDVGAVVAPVPPEAEQASIAEWVQTQQRLLGTGVTRVVHEIELLREFRTRLTADVVTGQVDIRAAAARLPELDLSDLVSDVGESDEDDLDAELAESLEAVDA